MGRPRSEDAAYARELGITSRSSGRVVQRLGGAEKLRSLSPEARAVLLLPLGYGNSKAVHKGGLLARGMKRSKDIRIQYD